MNKPRRAKSRRLLPLPLDANETKCGICLDEVEKRGKIGPCSHLYCFTCLLEWSKQNNTCPQCKLTFRCITQVDLKTDKFESKVFIKDKTLPTGHISSDEEEYINSSEIEDSDTDFIVDDTNIPQAYSEDEEEAQFTQRASKRKRTVVSPKNVPNKARGKRKSRVIWSDESDSPDENDAVHKSIIDNCTSPDLFESPARDSRINSSFVPTSSSCPTEPVSPLGTRSTAAVSPCNRPSSAAGSPLRAHSSACISPHRAAGSPRNARSSSGRSPLGASVSPFRTLRSPIRHSPNSQDRTRSVYFTSPKYNKRARWANLDQHVRNNKKRRKAAKTGASTRPGIPIPTLSRGNNTGVWLSTRPKSPNKHDKENTVPSVQATNQQYKSPFKKAQSPQLFDDAEKYFASIICSDEFS